MKNVTPSFLLRFVAVAIWAPLAVGLAWPRASAAQDETSHVTTHKQAGRSTDANNDLPTQLRELKAKAAALEAALEKRYPGAIEKDTTTRKGMMGDGGRGMMGSKNMTGGGDDAEMAEMMKTMRTMMEMKMMQMKSKGRGMMGDEMMGVEGKQKGMSGMGNRMDNGAGMLEMMGRSNMGGQGMRMKMTTALPGFPGASHIYHIGATGFFLDHPDHIQLTSEQLVALNGIKEKTLLDQATMQRQIDEAEQELWTLTAADEPDAQKIQAKVREIEKFRGDQRIAFIRAVGEAAKVLTDEQRQALIGSSAPNAATSTNPKN